MKVEDIEQLYAELESVCAELGVEDPSMFDINQIVNKVREYGQAQFDAGVESLQAEIEQLKDEITSLRYDLEDATVRSY